jgi:TRAP-type C4-dicarboxylate transport system substrate-binding protein
MDTLVGTRILNEMYEKFKPPELSDTTLMYAIQFPGAHLFNTAHSVKTLADLRDLKVRCFGMTATIIKTMGATPIALEAGEQAEGLQKGTINATVAGTTVKTYKLVPPLKYATLSPLTAATALIFMNTKTWNSLTPDIQKVFREVNKEFMMKDAQAAIDTNSEGLEWAKEKGVQIIEATPEFLVARDKGIEVLYDNYLKETEKRGVDGRAFLNEYRRLAKEYQK